MNAGIGYNNTFICCCMHTRLFGVCMYVHMMMVICLNTNAIEQLSLGKTEYIEYSMYVCMLYVCFSGKSASSWSTLVEWIRKECLSCSTTFSFFVENQSIKYECVYEMNSMELVLYFSFIRTNPTQRRKRGRRRWRWQRRRKIQ